jgi:5-methylthioadenosine/S-adenosylhomocysteine deaminase
LARAHNALTHCHISETQDEVAMTLKETGQRPIEWFASLGVLGDDLHAVHGVWLSDAEMKLLAQHGATVTHCPAANMILASGAAPIAKMKRIGVNVALATDGPASNDGQDMFEMMRLAALLARVTTMDAQTMPPRKAIDMATLGGATALKRTDVGRLEVGAKADLVMLDLNAAHIQPVGDVSASVVYNARGSDVDTVIVDGRVLMQNKQLVGLDEYALLAECRERAAHLAQRAGVDTNALG